MYLGLLKNVGLKNPQPNRALACPVLSIDNEHHCVLTEDWNPGVSCEARAVGYDYEWEAEDRDRLTAWIKLMPMVGYVDKGKKRTFG